MTKRFGKRGEDGFSLIDVVVTVAIVIALSIGGFIGYGGLANNARQAVVEDAAQQTLEAANVYKTGAIATKNADDAILAYNETSEEITVERVGDNCILATNTKHGNTAKRGSTCDDGGSEEATPVSNRFNGTIDIAFPGYWVDSTVNVSIEKNGRQITNRPINLQSINEPNETVTFTYSELAAASGDATFDLVANIDGYERRLTLDRFAITSTEDNATGGVDRSGRIAIYISTDGVLGIR